MYYLKMKTAFETDLKSKTFYIGESYPLLVDLELVKTVQPNFLIVFAKKLPLKPHPKIKNLFLFPSKLAGFFILG